MNGFFFALVSLEPNFVSPPSPPYKGSLWYQGAVSEIEAKVLFVSRSQFAKQARRGWASPGRVLGRSGRVLKDDRDPLATADASRSHGILSTPAP